MVLSSMLSQCLCNPGFYGDTVMDTIGFPTLCQVPHSHTRKRVECNNDNHDSGTRGEWKSVVGWWLGRVGSGIHGGGWDGDDSWDGDVSWDGYDSWDGWDGDEIDRASAEPLNELSLR